MMTDLRLFSYDFSKFDFELPIIRIDGANSYRKATADYPEGFIALSTPDAGSVFGIDWWLHIVGQNKEQSILDCGDIAYQALIALEKGVGAVLCDSLASQKLPEISSKMISRSL